MNINYPALPTSGFWVEGAHMLRIPKVNGGNTEYRCSKSGNDSDPESGKTPEVGDGEISLPITHIHIFVLFGRAQH